MTKYTNNKDKESNKLVSQGMFNEFRQEVKYRFQENSERFDKLETKIDLVEGRLSGQIGELDTRLSGRIEEMDNRLNAKIDGLALAVKKDLGALDDKMMAEFHRLGILLENQIYQNNLVLDKVTILNDRVDTIEGRVEKLEGAN